MYELVTRLSRLDTQYVLHLLQPEGAELPDAGDLAHDVPRRLRVHTRQRAQKLLRRVIHARSRRAVILRADHDRLCCVWLHVVQFQVVEDRCCCVWRRGPDNSHPREGQRQQHELRLDAVRRHRVVRSSLLLFRILVRWFCVLFEFLHGLY